MRLELEFMCLTAAGLVASAVSAEEAATGWSKAQAPAAGVALAIGAYGAGCVQGAKQLPIEGSHYRVMTPERHRNFGHPRLIDFIVELAATLAREHLSPLAVGDLGQPRGGPAPNGHASHQNGLDVDFWYSPAKPAAEQLSMVDPVNQQPSSHWSSRVPALLKLAAKDTRVERIFVNPVIKRQLCSQVVEDRGWLGKLRPWYGHDQHFHVRLACPDDSPECKPQPPPSAGDGCDELDWWFNPQSAKDRSQGVETYGKRVRTQPKLPATCGKVLKAP